MSYWEVRDKTGKKTRGPEAVGDVEGNKFVAGPTRTEDPLASGPEKKNLGLKSVFEQRPQTPSLVLGDGRKIRIE